MFIVPRTPISPRRLSPISMSTTSKSTSSPTSTSPIQEIDVYDKFSDIYFNCDMKVRTILLKKIIDFVGHPAYSHILRTMDQENAHHVMGYLRSQRSVEMYIILNQIIKNPLPTKEDFHQTIICR